MTENPPTPDQTPDEARVQRAEEVAERLAEKVEQTAHAQTERVEERAAKLAEHQAEERVEHRVEERAEGRADIKSELSEITAAIGELVDHMDRSIPADRVQAVLDAALAEERRDRQKLKWQIVSPVLIAIVVAGGAWIQSRDNGQGIAAAKKVATYVERCLQGKTEGLTPAQITEECGTQGDGSEAVLKVVFCVLQHEIGDRPNTLLGECYKRVQAGEFG